MMKRQRGSNSDTREEAHAFSQQVFCIYYQTLADRTRHRHRKELEDVRKFLEDNGNRQVILLLMQQFGRVQVVMILSISCYGSERKTTVRRVSGINSIRLEHMQGFPQRLASSIGMNTSSQEISKLNQISKGNHILARKSQNQFSSRKST